MFIGIVPLLGHSNQNRMFWLYFIPSSMGEFGMKLIILGLIISLIPNIGWNLVLKSIVLSKIKQDIKEKIDAR